MSGALTFAIVAGCPTVSTPYYYAEDLLALGRRRPRALRRSRRARRGGQGPARRSGPARAHARRGPARRRAAGLAGGGPRRPPTCCARRSRSARRSAARRRRRRRCRAPALSHLLTLVDDVGIIQHADGSVPAARLGLLHRRRRAPRDRRARPGAAPPGAEVTTARWPAAWLPPPRVERARRAACATSCPTTAAGWTGRTAAITSGEPPGRSARSSRPSPSRLCSSRA